MYPTKGRPSVKSGKFTEMAVDMVINAAPFDVIRKYNRRLTFFKSKLNNKNFIKKKKKPKLNSNYEENKQQNNGSNNKNIIKTFESSSPFRFV
jgi:hypothetical protein